MKLDFNKNIHPIFYNKKEYNEYMQEMNTNLEKGMEIANSFRIHPPWKCYDVL